MSLRGDRNDSGCQSKNINALGMSVEANVAGQMGKADRKYLLAFKFVVMQAISFPMVTWGKRFLQKLKIYVCN